MLIKELLAVYSEKPKTHRPTYKIQRYSLLRQLGHIITTGL
jgi:hypothetical protein